MPGWTHLCRATGSVTVDLRPGGEFALDKLRTTQAVDGLASVLDALAAHLEPRLIARVDSYVVPRHS